MLIACELFLRGVNFSYIDEVKPIIIWNPHEDSRIVTKDSIFQFHPFYFWEMIPGVSCQGFPEERVNTEGFRGKLYPKKKMENSLRLVCLGDSSTFGMGVEGYLVYSSLLEKEMKNCLPNRNIEVINAGVIGYTGFQGLQVFKNKILDYSPDIVILCFGAINEHFPANPYNDREKFEVINSWRYKIRSQLIKYRFFQLIQKVFGRNISFEVAWKNKSKIVSSKNSNWRNYQKGKPYKPRVSPGDFIKYIEEIIKLSQIDKADVILISPPRRKIVEKEHPIVLDYTYALESISNKHKIPLLDMRKIFFSIPDFENRLFLKNDYYHPNSLGHEFIAKSLGNLILRNY